MTTLSEFYGAGIKKENILKDDSAGTPNELLVLDSVIQISSILALF